MMTLRRDIGRDQPLASQTTIREYESILREDFHAFVSKVFKTLNPGTSFNDNWNVEAISKSLDDVYRGGTNRLVINVPPRSLKSLISSVAFPAWVLGRDPGASILCISHSASLATGFSRQFKQVVTQPWYQRTFPRTVFSKVSEDVLETTVGGARRATSIEAGLTGHGGEIILIDDPLDASDASSEAARERVIAIFRGSIFTRLNNKATNKIVLIMQRLHDEDLSGYLLKLGYAHLCMPAIATQRAEYRLFDNRVHIRQPGEILNPAQEPQAALDEIAMLMTARDYAAQYQQAPVPDTGSAIRGEWIQRYDKWPSKVGSRIVISWDTSIKGTVSADYSVATVWAEQAGEHYLLDVYRKRVSQHQQVRDAAELYNTYNPEMMLIESQGSGAGLIDFLRTDHGIHASERHSREDKETRMSRASYFFEKRLVHFPYAAPWLADLERELFQFPHGKHDDQVDSISQYLNWSHERGRSTLQVSSLYDPIDVQGPRMLQDVLDGLPRW